MSEELATTFIKTEKPDPDLDINLSCAPERPVNAAPAKKYRPGPASKRKKKQAVRTSTTEDTPLKVKPEPGDSFNLSSDNDNDNDNDNDFEEKSSFPNKKKKRWVAPKVHVNYTEAQTCTFCGTVCETWKKYINHVEDNHQDKLSERKRLKVIIKQFFPHP